MWAFIDGYIFHVMDGWIKDNTVISLFFFHGSIFLFNLCNCHRPSGLSIIVR